jgi:predicted transcriptional regulator
VVGKRRQRVEVTTEGAKMQTTTIALDEETHWRLRQLALDEKTTARDLIREAVLDLLKRRGRK